MFREQRRIFDLFFSLKLLFNNLKIIHYTKKILIYCLKFYFNYTLDIILNIL